MARKSINFFGLKRLGPPSFGFSTSVFQRSQRGGAFRVSSEQFHGSFRTLYSAFKYFGAVRVYRCITAGFILLFSVKASIAQDGIYELRHAGVREYHAGHFVTAGTLFAQAKEAAVSAGNRDLEACIDNDLGNLEIGADRPAKAYEAYHRALVIFSGMPDRYFETAATLRNLASADAQQGNYEAAQSALREARKIVLAHPTLADARFLMAEILNIQGIVLVRKGKLDKAKALIEEAMRTRATAGAREGLGEAQTLNNIGVISQMKHKYMEAERAFLKSLDVTANTLGPSHPDITLTLMSLGETYTAMGRYDDAARQFERGLGILRGLESPLYGRIIRILGLSAVNYVKQGNNQSAARTFKEAVELSGAVTVDEPTLPAILDTYAELLQKQGKPADARTLRADARRMRLKTALTVRVTTGQ
jgi:tetratricopeptide (TPR) repeat protein